MASRPDPRALGCLLGLFVGCRPAGLPEPPPGTDPSDPKAPIPAWRPAASPLEGSAFPPGEPAAGAGGHDHHHHHGGGAAPAKTTDEASKEGKPR